MNEYGLRPGYVSRTEMAEYVDTPDEGKVWQPDVYKIAAAIARQVGAKRLIDIGCGRADKLVQFKGEFQLVGMDKQVNLTAAQQAYGDAAEWQPIELETTSLSAPFFGDSVVICADVIEHLINPSALVQTLKNAVAGSLAVVLSTPDRGRYGNTFNSPPHNPNHVREWTLSEFGDWLTSEGLPITWKGWTINNDMEKQPMTCLLILSQKMYNTGEIEASFEVEKA